MSDSHTKRADQHQTASKARSYKVFGDVVRGLRQGRTWQINELAKHAGMSPRTIMNAEKSYCLSGPTIARIATAFGIEPNKIAEIPLPPIPLPGKRSKISFRITVDIEELDESAELYDLIARFMKYAQGIMDISDFSGGSTIVTATVDDDDLPSLAYAFSLGYLPKRIDQLQVPCTKDTIGAIVNAISNAPGCSMARDSVKRQINAENVSAHEFLIELVDAKALYLRVSNDSKDHTMRLELFIEASSERPLPPTVETGPRDNKGTSWRASDGIND